MDSPKQVPPPWKAERPVTELSNRKSENIDTATVPEIINILHDCEEEMFIGWQNYQRLHDKDFVKKLSEVSKYAAALIKNSADSAIILSGCGTSGRIAFFIATKMNSLLRERGLPQCFGYIIAGGDRALTHSVEAFEDSPGAGKDELIKVAKGKRKILFIGISCGLSAPFIAGQLHHCMSHLDTFLPVLLGFNTIHMVRDRTIEGWDHTLLTVTKHLMLLESSGQGYILNPIVGPEAITGSSRMKGGGVTKLILETCFLTALSYLSVSSDPKDNDEINADKDAANDSSKQEKLITSLFECYKQVWETSYPTSKEQLSKLIEQAGKSLLDNGHVYYAGWDTWGLLGLVDASECPPTFGSDFDDIRGFLKGGLAPLESFPQTMNAAVGQDPLEDETSLEFFKKSVLPSITAKDTVVFLVPSNDANIYHELNILLKSVMQKTQHIGVISSLLVDETQLDLKSCTVVPLGHLKEEMINKIQDGGLDSELGNVVVKSVSELALKSALNAISTGAHIAKGKVYQNYMVDLKLSNSKLLERGIGIVSRCAECSKEFARDAVMRAIYRTDDIASFRDTPVSSIIQTAGNVERVVPIAIILAIKGCTVREALDHQERAPVIRTSLLNLLQPPSTIS
ncbi:glucokinase regulatory protein isoform X1 [Strongylocentrotus purpuratus]|uniref:SIS domain-containing protein n=2 Tax=Strongylocentrotus purpuratus TaxID=7668 RepID=A0A7M7NQQ5_STRPU|nr:glucokinase regulatory protein isoform X1 [Strongylocentrotus purpuratus]